MKTIITICILLLASLSYAETIQLEWQQDISDDFKGWELYRASSPMTTEGCREEGILSTVVEYTGQTEYTTDYVISGAEGSVLYFRICAVDNADNKSDCSNEVTFTIPDDPPDVPYSLTIKVIP